MTPEQQAIAEEAYPMALAVASKFVKKYPQLAPEFRSAAGLAACEAGLRFDPSRGHQLVTFVHPRAWGACQDAVRCNLSLLGRFRKGKQEPPAVISLDTTVRTRFDDYTRLSLETQVTSEDEPVGWELESEDEVLAIARKLPKQHAEAVRRLYLDADTPVMRLVGKSMGVAESRISQVIGASLSMLREAM